jgi:hypothetical protein
MHALLRTILLAPLVLTGCGGYYIMSAPDMVAPIGGRVVPVARLQRNDFFVLALPVKGLPLRFQLGEYGEKGAGTDKLGYAGVTFDLVEEAETYPLKSGKHRLEVALQDWEGEEQYQVVPVYIWRPTRAVLAVDYDDLPPEASFEEEEASAALRRLASQANILYLTRHQAPNQVNAHLRLRRGGFPDGPVLLWQRKRWHVVREGKLKLPRIVIESRMESQLPHLVEQFPKLQHGLTRSAEAARSFADAGLQILTIDASFLQGEGVRPLPSWAGLADVDLSAD